MIILTERNKGRNLFFCIFLAVPKSDYALNITCGTTVDLTIAAGDNGSSEVNLLISI